VGALGALLSLLVKTLKQQIWHGTQGWGRGAGRIIECFGLEGTFKGHLAQTPRSAGQFHSVLFFSPPEVSRAHKDLNPALSYLLLVLPCIHITRSLLTASKASVKRHSTEEG